jgi:hydroxypyruvate isomerase
MIYTGYADFWFLDVPLPERVAKFARLGINNVETWAWRSKHAAGLMDEFAAACREHGATLNDTFDEEAGNLTDVNDHALCLDAWAESLEMAQRWGVRRLFMFSEQINRVPSPQGAGHIQGYAKPPSRNYTPMQKYANLLDGIHKVLAQVEKTNITVWFESLNTWHLHGPITCTTHAMAADLVQRINHPQFRFTFDCYHQQRTAGNLIQGLRDFAGLYDSVHIADVPTRGEPGTGEINFGNLARTLQDLGYDTDGQSYLGLEFYPARGEEAAAFARVRTIFG